MRVTRTLRPVVGETGEFDIAAVHEMQKGKYFVYEARNTSSCLVELDEEPPHALKQEALGIALQVAQLLHAKTVDEIQVMRKTVIDGSNVSGFQRTALVAQNGYVETSTGRINIPTIMLEEEAAKRITEDGKSVTFRLDRLGVPLVEIATSADIKDPEHAKETAEKIGMILRSTGKVKRGIGSIRQDVNVSIGGHARVEIKGFQELKSMPKIIDYEVKRMQKTKKEEAHVRKANADGTTSYLRPMPGAARLYPETDVVPVTPAVEKIATVELIEDKIKAMEKLGLGSDLATKVVKEGKGQFVGELMKQHKNIKPAFIAETVIGARKNMKSQFGIDITPTDDDFAALFAALDKGKIAKNALMDILKENKPVKEVMQKYAVLSGKALEDKLKAIIKKHPDAPLNALMGMAMAQLKGKADGREVMASLKKLVG